MDPRSGALAKNIRQNLVSAQAQCSCPAWANVGLFVNSVRRENQPRIKTVFPAGSGRVAHGTEGRRPSRRPPVCLFGRGWRFGQCPSKAAPCLTSQQKRRRRARDVGRGCPGGRADRPKKVPVCILSSLEKASPPFQRLLVVVPAPASGRQTRS